MSMINYASREINCKIVYYGPGLCGKTTNLQWVHEKLPIKNKGKMLSLATETDRTLFFDFLPIDLGTISGFSTRFQLYTVPGQVYYATTRKLVLQGADGVVFVADSQIRQLDENLAAAAQTDFSDEELARIDELVDRMTSDVASAASDQYGHRLFPIFSFAGQCGRRRIDRVSSVKIRRASGGDA